MNGDENNTSNSIVRSKIKGKTVVLVTESKSVVMMIPRELAAKITR